MKVFPSTLRRQIFMAILASSLFTVLMVWINERVVYLAGLVLLLSFILFLVEGTIIRPLGRITRESERIAQGISLGPIAPSENPRHEIEVLITLLNRLTNELHRRQGLLLQSHKNALIGSLTPGITHEINNPINNIVLTLETLIEDHPTLLPEEQLQLYQEALGQADRMSAIVNNLLEFSRADPPRLEEVEIEGLINRTVGLLHNEFKRQRIKISVIIKGSFPPLSLDRSGLQQVLVNLLLNSLQAMPGGGQLQIILNRNMKEVRLDIADSGTGIPLENLNLIFNPFFTTGKDRAGLGLTISCDILKKQGGRIEVDSREGQGSTFSLILPLPEARPAIKPVPAGDV